MKLNRFIFEVIAWLIIWLFFDQVMGIVLLVLTFVEMCYTMNKKIKELIETKEQLNKALLLLDQVQDITNRLDNLEHNNKEYR